MEHNDRIEDRFRQHLDIVTSALATAKGLLPDEGEPVQLELMYAREQAAALLTMVTTFYPLLAELTGIYSRYSRVLESKGKYNYGMLLLKTSKLLKEDISLKRSIRDRFKYIIIDEFHETNAAQNKIISAISDNNCIIFLF